MKDRENISFELLDPYRHGFVCEDCLAKAGAEKKNLPVRK